VVFLSASELRRTYISSNSVDQSHSQADGRSFDQEFLLWDPEVHCRDHKRLPLVPVMSHISPIHTLTSIFPYDPVRYFHPIYT